MQSAFTDSDEAEGDHPLRFQDRSASVFSIGMVTRILLILALCAAASYAAENPSPTSTPTAGPATDESVRQLLAVAQAHKLADSVMKQMDTLMLQTIEEATHGQPIPPKVQKQIDK